MNLKKAKALRSYISTEVQASSITIYKKYKKVVYKKVYTDENGVEHLKREKGTPRVMDICKRSVYQEMKKK